MLAEPDFVEHLVAAHAARVVILYGSAARGELTASSDVDVVLFREQAGAHPLSYRWRGLAIDAWVHPLSDAEDARSFVKLHGGRVLLESEDLGQRLLDRVREELLRPRDALGPHEERHRRAWVWKMFDRATRSGPQGDYRRHWLLYDLPETWCDLTRRHYLGPDHTLKLMKSEAESVYEALSRALEPGCSLSDIERAVLAVVGERGSGAEIGVVPLHAGGQHP